MPYQVELTEAPQVFTAVIRGRVRPGELAQFVPAACGEVWAFARSAALPHPGRHLALYLDGGGSVEVGVEVAAPFNGNDRVYCSSLPAGRVATTVHYGPYALLRDAHAAIHEWCEEHGCKRSGVSWELYGHWQDSWNADPSKIRTDVFYLLDGLPHRSQRVPYADGVADTSTAFQRDWVFPVSPAILRLFSERRSKLPGLSPGGSTPESR